MPHFRKLWRKFTTSEEVNEMTDDTTRLAWALLPLALDREGLGLDSAAWLRAQLFPLREDITTQQVRNMMDWWAERGMIIRYEHDGKRYFILPTFHSYQGDCEREAKSEIPAPPPDLCASNARPLLAKVLTGAGTPLQEQTLTPLQEQVPTPTPTPTPTPADGDAVAAVAVVLEEFGMSESETVAKEALEQGFDAGEVQDLVTYADAENLGPGWVRVQLRNGRRAPPLKVPVAGDPLRFIKGEYAEFIQH